MEKPKRARALRPKVERYVQARAAGKSQKEAGAAAGFAPGTAGQLERRDPSVRAAIHAVIEREMSARQTVHLLAQQARGKLPTKVVTGGGHARAEYDSLGALHRMALMHRLFGTQVEITGERGGPVRMLVGDLRRYSAAELELMERLVLRAAPDAAEEIIDVPASRVEETDEDEG